MDNEQLKRIADAIEEVLRLVKEDQERSKKYMNEEISNHLHIANDNLKRIADALDLIIKMVKEDQERSRKYMEKRKDD